MYNLIRNIIITGLTADTLTTPVYWDKAPTSSGTYITLIELSDTSVHDKEAIADLPGTARVQASIYGDDIDMVRSIKKSLLKTIRTIRNTTNSGHVWQSARDNFSEKQYSDQTKRHGYIIDFFIHYYKV
jgi:hypothetical protein